MADDNSDLPELLSQVDMETYLDREGIEYRRTHGTRGEQLNVQTCPACGGSKWKVYLNAETGLVNCFHGGCDKRTFNKYSFIAAHLGLAGRQVIDHIKQFAKESGWMPKRKATVAVNKKDTELLLPASFEIPHEGRNLKYLENRGVESDVAKYFHLRYCIEGYFRFPNPEGGWAFQDYSKRVIIPIFDLEGELVSFQGRDITGASEKKYLFPPGFAATGAHLYNGQNVVRTKRVLMGEGAFDVIAQKIALDGDPTLRDVVPIGSFGKHLSVGHNDSQLQKFLALRERGVEEVTIMWDGEHQAFLDAIQAGLELLKIGMRVRIATLPLGKDPNEVPPEVVQRAFFGATSLTKLSAVKLRMNNPYPLLEKALG
jgi:DNA primase